MGSCCSIEPLPIVSDISNKSNINQQKNSFRDVMVVEEIKNTKNIHILSDYTNKKCNNNNDNTNTILYLLHHTNTVNNTNN